MKNQNYLTFEDAGLPDKPCYRAAFQKGLKMVCEAEQPSSTPEEMVEIYRDIFIRPAQIICALQLPAAEEERLVKIALNGMGAFAAFRNKDVGKLTEAFARGQQAWIHGIDDAFLASIKGMTKDERLMLQAAFCAVIETAFAQTEKLAQEKDTEGKLSRTNIDAAFRRTSDLISLYKRITHNEFPTIDDKVKDAMCNLADILSINPPPSETPYKPHRKEHGKRPE
jgi:hypothetical protein